MRLEDLHKDESWLFADIYVNQKSNHNFANYNEIDSIFHPNEIKSYKIPCLEMDVSELSVLEADAAESIKTTFVKGDKVIFPVHPHTLEDIPQLSEFKTEQYFEVKPTSSTRTVFVDSTNYFVKLSVPRKISRFYREIWEPEALQSHMLTAELHRLDKLGLIPFSFGYFPESLALSYKPNKGLKLSNQEEADMRRSLGVVFREKIVHPLSNLNTTYVPLYSLMSKNTLDSENPTILEQLIESSSLTPLDYFIQNIVSPLIFNWFYMVERFGILFECNVQNVLAEIDLDSYEIVRYVYRDFEGSKADNTKREALGWSSNFPKSVGVDRATKQRNFSLYYDFRLGNQFFEIVFNKILGPLYGVSYEEYKETIKRVFHQTAQGLNVNLSEMFPSDTYYCLNPEVMFENNRAQYIELTNPKYR